MSNAPSRSEPKEPVISVEEVIAAIDAAGFKPTEALIEAVSGHLKASLREALVVRAFAGVRAAVRKRSGS